MKNSSLLILMNVLYLMIFGQILSIKLVFIKANLAVRQSLDLQRMQGSTSTIPVLILETCGTALVNSKSVKTYIGLSYLIKEWF